MSRRQRLRWNIGGGNPSIRERALPLVGKSAVVRVSRDRAGAHMSFRAVPGGGLALAFSLMFAGAAPRADTIVTRDGRRFAGDVTKTDTGYTVKTKFGEVKVGEGDFSQWVKDG